MNADARQPGRLIVVSGPSGSGKSTLLKRALAHPEVRARLSISATSRPPRPGEVAGRDYDFRPRAAFLEAVRDGAFLEWAEVHGNLYGTPAEPVFEALRRGESIVLEIDVQGARQVLERVPEAATIFVTVPDTTELEARLKARGTEDEATLRRRLETARRELEAIPMYAHVIVNDDLERAVAEMVRLLVEIDRQGPERHA